MAVVVVEGDGRGRIDGGVLRSPFFFFFLTFWLTYFEIRNSAWTVIVTVIVREGKLHCAISSQV